MGVAPVPVTVRYAASDDDIIAVHRFLCVVAGPTLPGPIDGPKSATEVWRCANHDVVLMAMDGDLLVGTLGLVVVEPWWGSLKYLANRWAFAIPGSRAWRPMIKEAKAIAVASEMEFHLISEGRGKIVIMNRSKNRRAPPNCHLPVPTNRVDLKQGAGKPLQ
jgi:hypothetical protein